MPNHVECVLRVSGPDAELNRFVETSEGEGHRWFVPERMRAAYRLAEGETHSPAAPSPLELHRTVPVPQDVMEAGFDPRGIEWCRANWGTKWGAYNVERVKLATGFAYFFRSAWRPPVEWLRRVVEDYPDLTFELWARDEYPYAMTVEAYGDEDGRVFEVCYGEEQKDAQP